MTEEITKWIVVISVLPLAVMYFVLLMPLLCIYGAYISVLYFFLGIGNFVRDYISREYGERIIRPTIDLIKRSTI